MKLSELEPGDAYAFDPGDDLEKALVALVVGKDRAAYRNPTLDVLWSDGWLTKEAIVDLDLAHCEVFFRDGTSVRL